ncbi:PfkB family carbohydrate kinase [Candidatus Omnitrophota bacterium]
MSVLVLGTVALDTVRTPAGARKDMLGGSAAHFAMSARLFGKVNLVASVGEDFPRRHIDLLRRRGIDLSSLVKSPDKSFRWEGKYSGDLNTAVTLRTRLGVLLSFKPKITQRQKNINYVFLANVDPDIQRDLLSQVRSPGLVALDSMNYWIKHKRKALLRILKRVDIYVANDQESRDLSGESNLVKAAKRLRSLGPQMVLIKKGQHGVLFYSDRFILSLPAFPIANVIDPTGAGDTFAGGFMGSLSQDKSITAASIKRALALGTVAASFNIEGFGVERTARLTIKDLKARLSRFKNCFSF